MASENKQVEELTVKWSNISLGEEEEGGMLIDGGEDEGLAIDTRWCLVGKLLTGRVSDFNAFQNVLAFLWQPGKGMYVKELSHNLFLFQFYHEIDIKRVVEGSPWTFDRKQLIIDRLKEGENPREINLNYLDMWIQLHDLQPGFMSEKVVRAAGNYIGEFLESDKNNFVGVWRNYLRVRVRIKIDQPLKRRMKIGKTTTTWFWTNLKYEKLPTFCFICGIMGHSKKFCAKLFETPEHLIEKPYGLWMRATPQKSLGMIGERWLRSGVVERRKEGEGGDGVAGDGG